MVNSAKEAILRFGIIDVIVDNVGLGQGVLAEGETDKEVHNLSNSNLSG